MYTMKPGQIHVPYHPPSPPSEAPSQFRYSFFFLSNTLNPVSAAFM